MSKRKSITLSVCAMSLALLAAALLGSQIRAATDGPKAGFSIPWWTVDAGGGESQGGAYLLRGTIGQPEAHITSGGIYTLKGGFWSGLVVYEYRVHIPLIHH